MGDFQGFVVAAGNPVRRLANVQLPEDLLKAFAVFSGIMASGEVPQIWVLSVPASGDDSADASMA